MPTGRLREVAWAPVNMAVRSRRTVIIMGHMYTSEHMIYTTSLTNCGIWVQCPWNLIMDLIQNHGSADQYRVAITWRQKQSQGCLHFLPPGPNNSTAFMTLKVSSTNEQTNKSKVILLYVSHMETVVQSVWEFESLDCCWLYFGKYTNIFIFFIRFNHRTITT